MICGVVDISAPHRIWSRNGSRPIFLLSPERLPQSTSHDVATQVRTPALMTRDSGEISSPSPDARVSRGKPTPAEAAIGAQESCCVQSPWASGAVAPAARLSRPSSTLWWAARISCRSRHSLVGGGVVRYPTNAGRSWVARAAGWLPCAGSMLARVARKRHGPGR